MYSARRLDFFEYDTLPDDLDEELPGYEPRSAPEYESEESVPLHSFQLLEMDRKLQALMPLTSSGLNAYRIITYNKLQRLSKKPHIELFRTVAGQMDSSAASLRFHDNGQLPWRPRANVSHESGGYAMESKGRPEEWTFTVGNTSYIWRLAKGPAKILLMNETGSQSVIARFTYSHRGTFATDGEPVGELIVYRHGMSADRTGIEKIVSALLIAMLYPRRDLGRNYWNDAP